MNEAKIAVTSTADRAQAARRLHAEGECDARRGARPIRYAGAAVPLDTAHLVRAKLHAFITI
jgi:hypothetical protein